MATQSTRFGTLRIVREQDLPLFCPRENDPLWALHPRVYLKPDSEGRARCPYCSMRYQMEDTLPDKHEKDHKR